MGNLREAHARIPGSQRLGNALRYIQQSIHFGVYLLTRFPLPMSAMDSALLRQLARAPAGHVRRVVLLDAMPTLTASLDDVAVRLSGLAPAEQRPRLRRWALAVVTAETFQGGVLLVASQRDLRRELFRVA